MTRISPFLPLLFVLGCDPTAAEPAAGGDSAAERGTIGKADLHGTCVDACGGKSNGNCYCDELCGSFGDCCSNYAPVCEDDPCLDGFDWVQGEGACFADAACYATGDGGWCTGACDEGVLDLSAEPRCDAAEPSCIEGFEPVATSSECLADAACYETPAGWCTGACAFGEQLDLSGTPVCIEAELCLEGFELVATQGECLADAACYAILHGWDQTAWCTGECPEGTALNLEGTPACEATG